MEINSQNLVEETRSRVLVVTEQRELAGFIHRPSHNQRETDVLNDEKPFIHLTQVEIRTGERPAQQVPFVAVNKASIIFVIPEEDSANS
jgi:hypothetical protein